LSKRILPLIPPGLAVERVVPSPDRITIVTTARATTADCPGCGQASARVHAHYRRRLQDLPWQGRPATLLVRARRFCCPNPACPRRTFAEHLGLAAARSARRTEGLPGYAIGRAVGASPLTVYRWLKAGGPPTHNKPERPCNVAPHEAFLARRWAEGCRNGARLWRELRAQGYRGGQRSVVRWTTRRRRQDGGGAAGVVRRAAVWPPPSSRRCARLLGTPPDRLAAKERAFLCHLADAAPDVIRAGELANAFAALLRERRPDIGNAGAALEAWMAAARESLLNSFVRGLERDIDAVVAAIATPWSTSPVEGQITRLKAIKRSMYGRAGFHLLRQRVLMAA
jgi:transposase